MRPVARYFVGAIFWVAMSFGGVVNPVHAEEPVRLPPAVYDPVVHQDRAIAILAGGCFWGVEGVFSHVKGVISVESGYHGGEASTATYDRTNDGDTGHAESVRIVYDPRIVSYGALLRVFFSIVADPTSYNRQGPDVGSQYRSAIVPLNTVQRRVAGRYLLQLMQGRHWPDPIVTRIENPRRFYRAEPYHQDFMRRNPDHPYIRRWDAPKLSALRAYFPALWQAEPSP